MFCGIILLLFAFGVPLPLLLFLNSLLGLFTFLPIARPICILGPPLRFVPVKYPNQQGFLVWKNPVPSPRYLFKLAIEA